MKKKISTAEYAETAEDFLPKDSKHESSHECFNLSASSRISAVWVGTHPDENNEGERRRGRGRRVPSMDSPLEADGFAKR